MARTLQHEGVSTGELTIFFVIISIIIGCILREAAKRTKIPYTPMLLLVGILIGQFEESLGLLGQSAQLVKGINPHMILLIFIPVLIFESSFNCQWHIFLKSLANILLLAGPGVLIGAALIAVCFKILLGYGDDEIDWFQAMTLGCILSATDPVAVVALLKELGASSRFNTLVEGQSLMNDGSSMVFFTLFLGMSKGQEASAGNIIGTFFRTAGGGIVLGVLMGFFVSLWIKRIIRDSILSMALTFVAAYLTFYIAQFTVLKVSGILSLVCFGLYLAAVGKKTIYPTSDYALHKVWSFIQYICETLIFILTGIVVGILVVNESTTISAVDWGKVFLFWIMLMIVRLLMVLILYPALTRLGYGLTRREMIVLIYGGLRGALGLTLSLIVALDEQVPQRFRQLTVFYTCSMAVLTIIINGLTCGKLVNSLGMINYPQIKRKLLSKCVRDVLHNTQRKFIHLKHEPSVVFADWREVEKLTELEKLGVYEVEDDGENHVGNLMDISELETSEMVEEIRFRFNRYLQKLCWQLFDSCEISDKSIDLLTEMCEVVNDDLYSGLLYWELISKNFNMSTIPLFLFLKDIPLIGRIIKSSLISKIYTIYETTTTFIEACEQTIHIFKYSFPLHTDHLNFVLNQVRQNLQEAVAYAFQLENNYPTIIKAVHTKKAATIILDHKNIVLKEMNKEGFIDEGDFQKLRKEISESIMSLRHRHFELEEVKFSQILPATPLFSILPSNQINYIMDNSRQVNIKEGQIIIEEDGPPKFAYFILSGSVKQTFKDFYFRKGMGTVINPYNFYYREKSKAKVMAITEIVVLEIKSEIIMKLFLKYPEFKRRWLKSLFPYALKIYGTHDFHHLDFTQRQLRRFIECSSVEFILPSRTLQFPHGGYIFDGKVSIEEKILDQGSFIPSRHTIKSIGTITSAVKFSSPEGFKNRIQKISHLYKADGLPH